MKNETRRQQMSPSQPPAATADKKISPAANLLLMHKDAEMISEAIICLVMLPPLRCARFPSLPLLQSSAAGFHCVSSPSGGLSSRRAALLRRCSFSDFKADLLLFFISVDSSSAELGCLQSGLVSEVSE
ncbi:hypothetical protein CHARACLAT_020984 [Characodon lateralis]|uniref:Uncharacterized protein n=1 Tax=Characodon lateralis TaxID=208331 RepID=A0ABU7F4Q3_9TELE|nr:hypothetical protein [Characodon lateralis]